MSIQTAIQNAQQKVANAYTAISEKGGKLPATQNLSNLPAAIESISGGGGSFIGITREVSPTGVFQMPATSFTFSLPNNAKDISAYALRNAFYRCTNVTSVDLSSLSTISGEDALMGAFWGCTSLTSVDLPKLSTISGDNAFQYAFRECTSLTSVGLTSVDLPKLSTISGAYALSYAFYGCTNLTSVDLSSLSTISGKDVLYYAFNECTNLTSVNLSSLSTISGDSALRNAFYGCTNLTSVDLSSLSTISGDSALRYAFYYCINLKELSFPALTSKSFGSNTNQFNSMLRGVTGCTVHFPSNLESVIGSWSDVTSGFGGKSNTTVLFDLPATT